MFIFEVDAQISGVERRTSKKGNLYSVIHIMDEKGKTIEVFPSYQLRDISIEDVELLQPCMVKLGFDGQKVVVLSIAY